MRDAQKPDHISLNSLIGRIRDGRFVIPDFQREFEWKPWDIRELMRSIFLDYYIGSLLLWRAKPESIKDLSCEELYGFDGKSQPEHIVLDGQQRLTAMHYAFASPDKPVPGRSNRFLYFIRIDKFMAEEYDHAFEYDWTRWAVNILSDPKEQYEQHYFPLSVVGAGGWTLFEWIAGYESHWRKKAEAAVESDAEAGRLAAIHADDAQRFGKHLKGITEEYQIAYVELDRDLEIDKVCDIFTQINSRGIRLDAFDLINALLKPKGLQLKHLWREAAPRLDFVDTEKMNVYILQLMSILRQSYCSPKYLYFLLPGQEKTVREPDGSFRKEVLIPDIGQFEARWHVAVGALERAINLLKHPQEFGAVSSQYLPYVSILPVFAALQERARDTAPSRQLDAQRKIRHWYWASVFMARYSGSVDSTSARDFVDITAWMDNDAVEPGLIAEFSARFRSLDLRKETKRGTSIYNGIFNLLVLRGARDWMTGHVPQYGDLDDHHIVPKDWGKKNKVGSLIDTILNRTPLTADTNRHVINDHLPNEYLPELMKESGEATVRATLESHFISPAAFAILLRDPFGPADFEAFLAERQRTLQEAIETLLIKERFDLSPQLRELDEKVETTEIALRDLIATALSDDASRLPGHVALKADERIRTALRKSASLDAKDFQLLRARLDYCDLRELQDTIQSPALWPDFAGRFRTKEALGAKFNQLADLRNGLRHSRTVDEITRKEGEAALIWFAQVLAK